MKQRITPEQLMDMTPEQEEKLMELWQPQKGDMVHSKKYGELLIKEVVHEDFYYVTLDEFIYDYTPKMLPLLSIGQMIELLEYKGLYCIKPIFEGDVFSEIEAWDVCVKDQFWGKGKELADALREAVKEVL